MSLWRERLTWGATGFLIGTAVVVFVWALLH